MDQVTGRSPALTAERVHGIFVDCLPREGEENIALVHAEGIVSSAGFHPRRLLEHAAEIRAMLDCLPDDFHVGRGGGMSFLNACMDRDGNQWTGMHPTMEQLFLLGMAARMVTCLMPREMWDVLPGGMPYYAVHDDGGAR